jgi:hypothetical protein
MKSTSELVQVKGALAWVEEQREIHLMAVGRDGSPIALSASETRLLAERLLKLADVLESVSTSDPAES